MSFPAEGVLSSSGTDDDFAADRERVLASDDFIALPDEFEIHEYDIMKRFCLSLGDDELRDRILHAISGRGAFGRFKDLARRRGIEQDWHAFRDDALKKVAASFLEHQGIPFEDGEAR